MDETTIANSKPAIMHCSPSPKGHFPRAAVFALVVLTARAAVAAETTDPQIEFFEKHIRPVLVEHCYECHATGAKNIRGELLLDSREAARRGGESGAAVVPGRPEESVLLAALRHESFEMPPDQKLSAETIDKFEQWIAAGAADPRDGGERVARREVDLLVGREFWSFRPLQKLLPPPTRQSHWPASAIDQFILARLEADNSQLTPNAPTDPATLLRRAKFDLLGLPPTVSEIRDFLANPTTVAYAQLVDGWLNSRQFGQRWGRHWLDVARFAESSGGGRSLMFPHAWRYRDYVIEAFNNDVPFDQFVREQIAGDLLDAQDATTRDRFVTATGFLTLGPANYELQDKELLELEIVDEQIDTIGRAFLGLTLGCVRCHDHKFDPIPMTDYYALAGILHSTESVVHSNVSKYFEQTLTTAPTFPEFQAISRQIESRQQQLQTQQAEVKRIQQELDEIADGNADAELAERIKELLAQSSQLGAAVHETQRQIKQLQSQRPPKPVAMAVQDHSQLSDTHLRIRGEIRNPGPVVPRGFVSVASPMHTADGQPAMLRLGKTESGRLELAEWIASPNNPLTARVIVNRVWHYLMGEGIVRTPDNFGAMGQAPTHPELLDYLAADFIEAGWSIKYLVRQIMLSRVYQLDSHATQEAIRHDPDNRLLARAHRRRLDAEAIRDAMLQISGQLEEYNGGRTIRKLAEYDLDYEFDTRKRSVYVPRFRNAVLDVFQIFDVANPNLVTGRRPISVLSTQALFVMNSEFVNGQARCAADRLTAANDSDLARLEAAFLSTLGRWPYDAERELVEDILGADAGDESTPQSDIDDWAEIYHLLFGSVDFRYLH